MKAAVISAPGRLEILDISKPMPTDYEALVKIEACGLCGTTDRHLVEGRQCYHPSDAYPAVLGHESVGIVVSTGASVKKFRVGDRVTRPLAIWPGTKRDGLFSAWGGFAEWGVVRDTSCEGAPAADFHSQRQHVIPPSLSIEDAVAAISLAEVASWMSKLGSLERKTVVIGGSGFAACVMAQCAKSAGAARIVVAARNSAKMEKVIKNGATEGIMLGEGSVSRLRELLGGSGADFFLDAAGHQAVFEEGLTLLRPGGMAAIYGAPENASYRLPLGAVGGDFLLSMHFPQDDVYLSTVIDRMQRGELQSTAIRSHVWQGLESLPAALEEQVAGKVMKGLVLIP